MLSPQTRRNISRIIPFALIWLVFSMVYSLAERGLLGELNYYPSTGNPYHFERTFFITALTSFILGMCIGSLEILYLNKLFMYKRFFLKLIYKTIIYLVIIIVFLLIVSAVYNAIELGENPESSVSETVWIFFTNYAFWSVAIYIAAVIGVSLFYTEVSDNLGHGVLTNFFTGRYHTPRAEERIFMFLDMKSSTAIAEKLGHVRYFEMLRTYFSDLSDPVIHHGGEIYQYAGDEIIVSWKLQQGLLNNNCVQCFFTMKAVLASQAEKYTTRFGMIPGFKAGLHTGKVTTGEIGTIKKEIIFTGDVMNTTSRIQGLCNTYQAEVLISDTLLEKLHIDSSLHVASLGEVELRGKGERMKVYSLDKVIGQ